jgi:hypothetical protein
MFGMMWTLISAFSTLGDFILIVFQRYFGFVATRLFYGAAQTAGYALIGMYQMSAYNVIVGMVLLCFAGNRSFSQNIQTGDLYFENGTRRFSVFGTGIGMFGYTVFLLAKKLDETDLMTISSFFFLLSSLTAIVHIRTLFLLPKEGFPTTVTHEDDVFRSSWFGRILAKKRVSAVVKEDETKTEESNAFHMNYLRRPRSVICKFSENFKCKSQVRMSRVLQSINTGSSIKDVLKEYLSIMITKRFLLFTGMYVILLYRMQMGLSHYNPWLDYTYSDIAASCSNQTSFNSRCKIILGLKETKVFQ